MSHEFAPVQLRDNFTAYVKEHAGTHIEPDGVAVASQTLNSVHIGFLYDPEIVLAEQVVLLQEIPKGIAGKNKRTVCVNLLAKSFGVSTYVTPNDIDKELSEYKKGVKLIRPTPPQNEEEEIEDEKQAEENSEILLFRVKEVKSELSERRRPLSLGETEKLMEALSYLSKDPEKADEELIAFFISQFDQTPPQTGAF